MNGMIITERSLRGVFEIQLEPKEDVRGFFMRVYDDEIFKKHGIQKHWVQENHSLSVKKSTVRGFHFQLPPATETKLVRVISGAIYDVFVDLRKNSPTFGRWDSIILSEENKKMLFIPRGFAHGMCTLTNNSAMYYKVDNYYTPEKEFCIRWNDPQLGVKWPIDGAPIISEKDAKAKSFKDFIKEHGGIEL
jgi:dTDP-4-dehydrorhamnose 3,5-epimerase